MKKLLEAYYKRPILYDYILAAVISIGAHLCIEGNVITAPNTENSLDFASDIGTAGLTISGFLLTLITILMTLKSNEIINGDNELSNDSPSFKIFLKSKLYVRSIEILINGVFSLVMICFIIFGIRMLFSKELEHIFFYLNIIGLLIILSTFLRCFYVLNLILKMQKNN